METTAPGEWVQGFKFDDIKTRENRFIFKEDLDAVTDGASAVQAGDTGDVELRCCGFGTSAGSCVT